MLAAAAAAAAASAAAAAVATAMALLRIPPRILTGRLETGALSLPPSAGGIFDGDEQEGRRCSLPPPPLSELLLRLPRLGAASLFGCRAAGFFLRNAVCIASDQQEHKIHRPGSWGFQAREWGLDGRGEKGTRRFRHKRQQEGFSSTYKIYTL